MPSAYDGWKAETIVKVFCGSPEEVEAALQDFLQHGAYNPSNINDWETPQDFVIVKDSKGRDEVEWTPTLTIANGQPFVAVIVRAEISKRVSPVGP
jgi:hypothetical protein